MTEWISGDRSAIAQWDYGVIGGTTTNDTSSSSSAAPSSTAAAKKRGAVIAGLEPDDDILELAERQASDVAETGTHRTYGTRTDFSNINYATHYTHPFVPKTSDHVDPIPTASPTFNGLNQPAVESPTPSTVGGIAYHKVYRQTQLLFSEVGDQTEYGYWYVSERLSTRQIQCG